MENVDKEVSAEKREELKNVLRRHSKVFSKGEWDLGWTNLVTHTIDTADAKPFRQPMRRYPPIHLKAIDQHLSDMLEQGVIEPAASPWASNVVLAKKKDGTLRCCIDCRQLNELTRKDAYPLPSTGECLDAMSGSVWFSTFDLRSRYVRSGCGQDGVHYRLEMYSFKTMPFGLCNAVATFQRLMDLVLNGLNLEICHAYLDDIILLAGISTSTCVNWRCCCSDWRRLI